MVVALLGSGLFIGYMQLYARLFACHETYCKSIAFETSGWHDKERRRAPEYVRVRMADSLLKQDLIGRPRREIDTLLGPPDETDYFLDYDYVYWLGPESGMFGIDSEWLGIKFDGDIVTEATLLRD